jgi:hypothetical protein
MFLPNDRVAQSRLVVILELSLAVERHVAPMLLQKKTQVQTSDAGSDNANVVHKLLVCALGEVTSDERRQRVRG